MKTLIRHGHVIDPSQSLDEIIDLAIEEGKIAHIGNIPSTFQADHVIDATNRWVVPGFIDTHCRPHMQHPQGTTLYQEAKTALQCGFTTLCIPPDSDPIIDTTANVLRILKQSDPDLPRLYPIGALTTQLNGEFMVDLTALKNAGCIAFSQAQSSVKNLRVLRHCYHYAASFSLPIIIYPNEPTLSKGGIAHEGVIASQLGLFGIPEIAETIAIAEHLLLIEETGVHAHFTCLSTAKGAQQILEAKAKGLSVTADTAMHSLHLTEQALLNFDSNCHVYPPLRTEKDRLGLIEGVKTGALDAICSDHRPLDSAAKLAPFGDTLPGLSSLDTFVSLGIQLIEQQSLSRLDFIRLLSTQPAAIFQLPGGTLAPGAVADFTVIDPSITWEVNDETLKSKGKNNPFKNRTVKGKVMMTFLEGRPVYHNDAS